MSDEQENARSDNGLIDRLLKRHVIQSAADYVAGAWGAVEIPITLTEKHGWPDWINTVALSIFAAGSGPYQTETVATVAVLPIENLSGDAS